MNRLAFHLWCYDAGSAITFREFIRRKGGTMNDVTDPAIEQAIAACRIAIALHVDWNDELETLIASILEGEHLHETNQ